KPHDMITSSTPCCASQSIMKEMSGLSTSGTSGLGTVEVRGRRRVPSPPTRITACTRSPPSDPLVDQAYCSHRLRIERVAPVDDDVSPHRRRHMREVELHELRPLGHEHQRVGAA